MYILRNTHTSTAEKKEYMNLRARQGTWEVLKGGKRRGKIYVIIFLSFKRDKVF